MIDVPTSLPAYLTVNAALREFGIGRTKLYELIREDRIVSNRRLGRRLIETASLLRLLSETKKANNE